MQRNPQNLIKLSKDFKKKSKEPENKLYPQSKSTNVAGYCPACKTEVPFKPGFRVSALKCPKCGALLGKQ